MNEQGSGGINENSIQNKFPRLRPKNSLSHSRLKPKSRPVNNENVGMFRNIMVPAASRVANSVREATSSISNRILSGRDTSEITSSAEELRNRSHENHQQEVEALFKNLAISNGGHLPDEKVREMEEIALEEKPLVNRLNKMRLKLWKSFPLAIWSIVIPIKVILVAKKVSQESTHNQFKIELYWFNL